MTIMSIAACILHWNCANTTCTRWIHISIWQFECNAVEPTTWPMLSALSVPMPNFKNTLQSRVVNAKTIALKMKCMHTHTHIVHSRVSIYDSNLVFVLSTFEGDAQHNRIIPYYSSTMFCFSNRPILAVVYPLTCSPRNHRITYIVHHVYPFHVCVRAWVRSVFPPKLNRNWTIVQMQSKCEIENGLMRDIKFNIDTLCAWACASFCHLAFIAMHVSQLLPRWFKHISSHGLVWICAIPWIMAAKRELTSNS